MYVFIEQTQQGLQGMEVVGYARQHIERQGLDCLLRAVVFGAVDTAAKGALGAWGADEILCIGTEVAPNAPTQAEALRNVLAKADSCQLLMSQSAENDLLVGKLGIWCDAAAVSKVAGPLKKEDDGYVLSRSVYTGKAIETRRIMGERFVLSIAKSAIDAHKGTPTEPIVKQIDGSAVADKWEVIQTTQASKAIPLADADVVVSGGRGMKGAENWHILEALAAQLGAALACSKPVSDMEWRPHHEHVGQTGIKISPKLYIAVGISGAIQHLAGVSSSQVIIVINEDKEAPFFKAADYGMVGDAHTIVPQLTQALQERTPS